MLFLYVPPYAISSIFKKPRPCTTSQPLQPVHNIHPPYQTRASLLPDSDPNLYTVLGLPKNTPTPLTHTEIRRAYLSLAKVSHPDVAPNSDAFDSIARAWAVLGDASLRRIYDTAGSAGIAAIRSIDERAAALKENMPSLDGDQLDFLSDTGQLIGGLLSPVEDRIPAEEADIGEGKVEREDACPRSVEEAVWNVQFHADRSVRYYGLWWIYKFKVKEAEAALVNVLRTSMEQTSLGGFGLRRRAALALGAVAAPPTDGRQEAVQALGEALRSEDYFLRYRAAEALANIAQRAALGGAGQARFPERVVGELKEMLRRGVGESVKREEAWSGYSKQEGLFDMDKLDEGVRERLEKIFEDRRQNEERSRRTTMTPQLGVDEVGKDTDEPFEWVLKAVSAISSQMEVRDDELVGLLQTYTKNPVPLVRYAAHKALFALTGQSSHAEEIVKALEYGVEHHYSQRVLIRDLGDLGYCQGAAAVAACPMVENSFKILALKNMIAKRNHDPEDADVRNVLGHMDSLL